MTDPIQPPPGYTATPPTKEEWEEYERSQQAQKPWPTERPEGWGVGWTCRIDGKGMIVIMLSDEQTDGVAYCPLNDSIYQFAADQITGYGPRAEVGG